MFNIQEPRDSTRLLSALSVARSGRVDKSCQFSKVLAELGLAPVEHSKAGWLHYLKGYGAPTKGSDLERYAKPVLVQALVAMLQSNYGPIDTVIDDMRSAIEVAKSARRDQKKALTRSLQLQQYSPLKASLFSAQIDDALSLLERAANSHNLLGAHRMRVLKIAEKLHEMTLIS